VERNGSNPGKARHARHDTRLELGFDGIVRALEQFSAKLIRLAVKNCGTRKKRADSTSVERL
jgi:hypothetical protein